MAPGDYGWLIMGGAAGAVGGYYFAMIRVKFDRIRRGWRRPL